mmetsp:Transcript_23557/g.67860  ORF Transcript_23557/g.67860 Transcript_23557/m.67860 type:complete len:326 (+) Transcript_23557:47-1024(+)
MAHRGASTAAAAALRFAARQGIAHSLHSTSVGNYRTLVVGVSASAAAAAALAVNTPDAACRLEGDETNGGRRKPRPPPRFTRHVPHLKTNSRTGCRSFSSSRISAIGHQKKAKEDDCPICRKYSKGPCGQLFTEWMACTDANQGKDEATEEELHLSKCSKLAEKLAECLGRHAEEYSGPLEYDDDDNNVGENDDGGQGEDIPIKDLANAWLELIADLESSSSKNFTKHFPADICPELEVRPSSGWGVGAFAPADHREESLVLAYLKDQSGTVLAAGSGQDLQESGGYLRFELHKDVESITACAIYGGKEDDPIYQRTARIPPSDV